MTEIKNFLQRFVPEAKWKQNVIIVCAALAVLGSLNPKKDETQKTENQPNAPLAFCIFDASQQDASYIEKIYGVPTQKEAKYKQYPCKDIACESLTYSNGNEAIFKNNKLFWFTINNTKLPFKPQSVEVLGVRPIDPDIENDAKISWLNCNGWAIDINSAGGGKISFILAKKLSDAEKEEADCRKGVWKRFSKRDGSYEPLVNAVKKRMNDPSSFEHSETTFMPSKKGLNIRMQYRGSNAFGAKILSQIKVYADCEGMVIEEE